MKLDPKKTDRGLARLDAAQALLKKGENGVSFKGGLDRFQVFSASVAETLSWPPYWTAQEITNRVREAIIGTVKSGNLGWESFSRELNKAAVGLLTAKLKSYTMWTKINATPDPAVRAISYKLGEVDVKIVAEPPKRLGFDHLNVPNTGLVQADYPKGGMVITAKGRFRSDLQAGEGLSQSISDVCALINLAEHRHRRTFRFGEARPKATLLSGKYHYLFREGVSIHQDGLWYNPDFREDFWNTSGFVREKIGKSAPYVRRILRDLRTSRSSDRIRSSIRLLHEGWQSHNVNQRIHWTWTAFETLLSRSIERTDDYETVKRRALFIAKNPDLEDMALDLAIKYRNRFVHENGQCGAAENVAEYLDEYLILIIEWLLQRFVRFENHARFLDMLDAPRDVSKLKGQIIDRRRALKARGIK